MRLSVRETRRALNGQEKKDYLSHIRHLKSIATLECFPLEEEQFTDGEWIVLGELFDILPHSTLTGSNPLSYLLAVKPLDFLSSYCNLARLYEEYELPLFSALPLRRSFIQSHVIIDTTILATHVLRLPTPLALSEWEHKMEYWDEVFKLENKAFRDRAGLYFRGTISTNGTEISIHLTHHRTAPPRQKTSKAALKKHIDGLYFENHVEQLKQAPNIVVIDPNKRDILFCRDKKSNSTLRYTSNQRVVEVGSRVYQQVREKWKQQEGITTLESSMPTHKTMDLLQYINYLVNRETLRPTLSQFYKHPQHNKWRFKSYCNTQKSESLLIKNMRKKFGKQFTVIMGDWSDAGRTNRFQVSTKTVGWRNFFKKNHIPCFLIDEYKTSSHCPNCESKVETFKRRPSSRPWRRQQGHTETVHGLLGCTNLTCCKQSWTRRHWNRDNLSVCNMMKIVDSFLNGNGRPLYLSRAL